MRYKSIYNPKKKISLFAKISIAVFLVSLSLFVLSKSFVPVAQLVNKTLSETLRLLLSLPFNFLPVSVFEIIFLLIPLWLVLFVWLAVRAFRRGRALRFLVNLLSLVLVIFSGYALTLGIPYNAVTLEESMDLAKTEVTADRLADIMTELRDEVNELSSLVEYGEDGASISPYGIEERSRLVAEEHSEIAKEYGLPYGFKSNAKSVLLGDLMSRFRFTGIYTFFTGEANVNSAYPDYDMTFTMAHELSHQRGIIRENEANFMAYLILSRSDDAYLRYAGALSMYEYISSALYRTDKERYTEIAKGLADGPRGDIRSSNAVTVKYADSKIGNITNKLNDAYLKGNGTEGVVSYGMVVELAVSYFEK